MEKDLSHSVLFRFSGKIIEGKYFENAEGSNVFAVLKIDNQEINYQTLPVAIESPYWSEEFSIECPLGFLNAHFYVYQDLPRKGSKDSFNIIGKAVIPQSSMTSTEEEWYMLKDGTYEKAMGTVQLLIKHFPPKFERKTHGFQVTVQNTKGLAGSNPFVVLHLLPDANAYTTQQTQVRFTSDATFNEKFYFSCQPTWSNTHPLQNEQDPNQYSLHCAVWNDEGESKPPTFLGHVTIPLAPVIHHKVTNRIYTLTSLDDDGEFNTAAFMKEPRRMKANSTTSSQPPDELRQHVPKQNAKRYREFVKYIQNQLIESQASTQQHTSQKQHVFVEKTFAGSTCHSCQNMMVGTQLSCTDCKFVCHLKCNEGLPPTCGGKGAIRLKLEIRKTVVLTLPYYLSIIELLRSRNYQILIAYGKFSSSREDIARRFIKILDSEDGLEFIKSIVTQEIMHSEDSKTLFRANSLATKALDVYMKAVGTEYLRETLEGVIKLVITSPISFEIDPLRLEASTPQSGAPTTSSTPIRKHTQSGSFSGDKTAAEIIAANSKALKELNTIITDCILESAPRMHKNLCEVFKAIQETVSAKFPGEEMVRYTSVSGFIILRFFAPAILCPPLFGLKIGKLDSQATRKLTLIAKTLQNLGNLVEFGQKEAYMEPMNVFINSKIEKMKRFLDEISNSAPIPLKKRGQQAEEAPADDPYVGSLKKPQQISRDCADLIGILSNGVEKLKTMNLDGDLVSAFVKEVNALNQKADELEARSGRNSSMRDLIWMDVGVEVHE